MLRSAILCAFVVAAILIGDASGSAPLGSQAHPVPLGRSAPVGGGWFLRVRSVDWNAARAIAAVPGQIATEAVPSAAVEVMLTVTASYGGAGEADVRNDFADRVFTTGSNLSRPYSWDSGLNDCGPNEAMLPRPDLQPHVGIGGSFVFFGTVLKGHICFEVARLDIRALRLYVLEPRSASRATWFVLH